MLVNPLRRKVEQGRDLPRSAALLVELED